MLFRSVTNEAFDRKSGLVAVASSLRRVSKREFGASLHDTCRVGYKRDTREGPELIGLMGPSHDDWVMDMHLIEEGERRRNRIICQAGSIVGAYRIGSGNPFMSPVEVQSLSLLMVRTREPS